MLTIYCTLVLPVISLSLGFASFFMIFSTAGMVLGPISSLLGLVVDISLRMLCEHDLVLCTGLFISKEG